MTGNRVEDHPLGTVLRRPERSNDLEALDRLLALLALAVPDDLAKLALKRLKIDLLQQVLDRLGTHATAEVVAVAELHLTVESLVVDEILDRQLLEALERVLEDFLALGILLVEVLQVALCLGFELLDAVGGVDILVELLAFLGLDLALGDADEAVALGLDRRTLLDEPRRRATRRPRAAHP